MKRDNNLNNIKKISHDLKESECKIASLKVQLEQEKLKYDAINAHLKIQLAQKYPLHELVGRPMIYHYAQWGFEPVKNQHEIFTEKFCEELNDDKNKFNATRIASGQELNTEFQTQNFKNEHYYVVYDNTSIQSITNLTVEFVAIVV